MAPSLQTPVMRTTAMSVDDSISPFRPSILQLAEGIARGRVVALTGAGVSTDSGIPEYRDDDGEWKHRRPMLFRDFVTSAALRRRYWARSLIGYRRVASARPNLAHAALAELESRGHCHSVITQNVDGLHQAAGSETVVDLHGTLARVVCLQCGTLVSRDAVQLELARLNPEWSQLEAAHTPDGDADLDDRDYDSFRVVDCSHCGGTLKPDVVFFGEHTHPERVRESTRAVERANALLVVGSSLMVFSGYRFVRLAHRRGIPVWIVNRGRTRADGEAELKITANAGQALRQVLDALRAPDDPLPGFPERPI